MENIKHKEELTGIEQMLNMFSREELIEVNKMVVHRIRIMDELFQLAANSQFQPGHRVSWKDMAGFIHQGVIQRVNRKTITVIEDGNEHGFWKISARALTRI
ncbi:MAG: hypothetical protein NTU44_13175 [Bacteroidetes bacterium]|nr:hypothetical protein [Bacteroidota bacterium]